jgi:hypothetical protein
MTHPLITAIVNAATGGALALAACGVAGLAFELENAWTLSGSLTVAVICSLAAAHNILIFRRTGIR